MKFKAMIRVQGSTRSRQLMRLRSAPHFPTALMAMTSIIITISFILNMNCNPIKYNFEIHGHQGYRSQFPGNTLPGFKFAIEKGVKFLEMDVVVSKDRKLIVHHDHHLEKGTCLGPDKKPIQNDILISSLTYEEIKTYDCGSIPNSKFPLQKLVPGTYQPSLEEVIQLVQGNSDGSIVLNIETKHFPANDKIISPAEITLILYETLKKYEMLNKVYIQSFDYRTLKEFKKLHSNATLVALFEGNTVDYIYTAKSISATIVSPNHEWIDKNEVNKIRSNGIRVVPWTVNDKDAINRLLDFNVDGIISDDPLLVKETLSSKIAQGFISHSITDFF